MMVKKARSIYDEEVRQLKLDIKLPKWAWLGAEETAKESLVPLHEFLAGMLRFLLVDLCTASFQVMERERVKDDEPVR
jgi:hypothetical protein